MYEDLCVNFRDCVCLLDIWFMHISDWNCVPFFLCLIKSNVLVLFSNLIFFFSHCILYPTAHLLSSPFLPQSPTIYLYSSFTPPCSQNRVPQRGLPLPVRRPVRQLPPRPHGHGAHAPRHGGRRAKRRRTKFSGYCEKGWFESAQ